MQFYFIYAIFCGGSAVFKDTTFNVGVDFGNSRFTNNDTRFFKTKFLGGSAVFSQCHFSNTIEFYNNSITYDLEFTDIRFDDTSNFKLTNPKFIRNPDTTPRILFKRVKFIPFNTFFENIIEGREFENCSAADRPIIIFRQCNLRDVFFSYNNMTLMSFLGSAFFEKTHLHINKFDYLRERFLILFPYKRKNIIAEELLFKGLIKNKNYKDDKLTEFREHFEIQNLRSFGRIAEMYRRFKTSSDSIKDYHLASWFYFNEYEMLRNHYSYSIKSVNSSLKRLQLRFLPSRRCFYFLYRIFAGYGEKPSWSFFWLTIVTVFFSSWYSYRGLKLPNGFTIDYEFAYEFPNIWDWLHNAFYAVIFTFSRVIPVNYLPFDRTKFVTIHDDVFISILNSFILILLIIFIGIGLKRHFRRF